MDFKYTYNQNDFVATTLIDIADMQIKLSAITWNNSVIKYVNSTGTMDNTIFTYDLFFSNELSQNDKITLDNFIKAYHYILLPSDICLIRDSKPSGTNGGFFPTKQWIVRTLNVLDGLVNFVSLSNNQITLSLPGFYLLTAKAPACNVQFNQTRLRNVTDNTYVYGTNAYGNTFTQTNSGSIVPANGIISYSEISSLFTITKPTVFQIEHRCSGATNDVGFGIANGFGSEEVYTTVTLRVITRT